MKDRWLYPVLVILALSSLLFGSRALYHWYWIPERLEGRTVEEWRRTGFGEVEVFFGGKFVVSEAHAHGEAWLETTANQEAFRAIVDKYPGRVTPSPGPYEEWLKEAASHGLNARVKSGDNEWVEAVLKAGRFGTLHVFFNPVSGRLVGRLTRIH